MALKKGFREMLREAGERIDALTPIKASEAIYQKDVVLVDIRDVRELKKEGHIPGAIHAPRGMLEFWVDPDSPYYKPVFKTEKQLILYCQSGWRSTLATATLLDMGFENVAHIDGGFSAWKTQSLPVEPYSRA